MRTASVVKRESDITRRAFPFELLHARGPATNMSAMHWHDFLELSFVRSGTGTYQIEDKSFEVGPGDIVIINNTERHRVTYEASAPLHETVLHFSPELLSRAGRPPQSADEAALPLFRYDGAAFQNKPALSSPTRRAVRRLVGEIGKEWAGRRPWYEPLIRAKLMEIVSLLLRESGIRAPESPTVVSARRRTIARLEQILAWLRANSHRPVSLAAIARRFSMRPSYFSDYFRRNLGVTLTEYLMQVRIREATRLLEEGRMGSTDAAFACGFNTTASFYRAFKKVTGASPGALLRQRASTKGG
jgi:AraC-like DNA-binding protein